MRTYIAIALGVLVAVSLSGESVVGADCQQIIKNINAERNFL